MLVCVFLQYGLSLRTLRNLLSRLFTVYWDDVFPKDLFIDYVTTSTYFPVSFLHYVIILLIVLVILLFC